MNRSRFILEMDELKSQTEVYFILSFTTLAYDGKLYTLRVGYGPIFTQRFINTYFPFEKGIS